MRIWIVKQHQDNGEYYEDRYAWDNYWYFSSWEKAYAFYCDNIIEDYKGEFSIIEKTLDTQEETISEVSPWGGYTTMDDYLESDYYEVDDELVMPEEDYDYYACAEYEGIQKELEAEAEWLEHKGEQYEILESIEQDRLEDELKESDAVWESLGMLD